MAHTKEYYEQHKEELSRKRRERYAANPSLREAAKERARKWREQKRQEENKLPDDCVQVGKKVVKGFGLEQVADQLGILPYRIKYYHRKGYIPAALRSRPARIYTPNQVAQIKRVVDFLEENLVDLRRPAQPEGKKALAALEDLKLSIQKNWET